MPAMTLLHLILWGALFDQASPLAEGDARLVHRRRGRHVDDDDDSVRARIGDDDDSVRGHVDDDDDDSVGDIRAPGDLHLPSISESARSCLK